MVDAALLSTALGVALVGALGARFALRRQAERSAAREARLEMELAEARQLLDGVFDAAPTSLILLDEELTMVRANPAAERLHGTRLGERRCHEALVDREEPCERCPAVESFRVGLPSRDIGQHSDARTGEILAVESHRIQVGAGRRYVLLVERSLTEQKKLEARLLHQEKMAAFGLLAAGIAHDMGNPLNSIGVQLQLVDDEALAPDVAAVLGTVREETERLRRILRELVDFARRRRDEASLISVQSVVEDAVRLLRHDRRSRDVKTVEHYDPEAPPVFMIEDHLMQVVLNLLINALDAMHGRGTLRIELVSSGPSAVLRIHDSGEGMDRAVLERCFEPLFTTKQPGEGTGLGLSISKDIIEAAGGRIELHSAPGQGTTVVIVLPAAVEAGRDRAASGAAGVSQARRT